MACCFVGLAKAKSLQSRSRGNNRGIYFLNKFLFFCSLLLILLEDIFCKVDWKSLDCEATNYTEGYQCDFSLTHFLSPTSTGNTCVFSVSGFFRNRMAMVIALARTWVETFRNFGRLSSYTLGGGAGRWKEEPELGSRYLFFLHPVIQSKFSSI